MLFVIINDIHCHLYNPLKGSVLWYSLALLGVLTPCTTQCQFRFLSLDQTGLDSISSKSSVMVQDPNNDSYLYVGTTTDRGQGADVGERRERTAHFMSLDANGEVLWSKGITDSSSWACGISSAIPSDNGFIVNGHLDSVIESNDLFEIDNAGNVLWSKSYTYGVGSQVWILDKTIKVQGGYLNVGATNTTQVICHKLDASGNIIWQKGYDLTDDFSSIRTRVTHAMELESGNYFLIVDLTTTVFNPPFEREIVLLNINADGSLAWAKSVGNGDVNKAHYAYEDANGNIIIAAEYYEDFETYDAAIYRFDPAGNLNLAKGYSSSSKAGKWIGRSGNEWYMFTGANHLIHLDSDFEVIGAKSITRDRTEAYDCFQSNDGSVVCGQQMTSGTLWDPHYKYGLTRTELSTELSCLDSAITLESYNLLHFPINLNVSVYNTQFNQESTNLVFEDIPYEKIDLCYGVGVDEMLVADSSASWTVYPNPTTDKITVELQDRLVGGFVTIINELGQSVLQSKLTGSKTHVNLGGLKPGVYGIRIESSNVMETKKIVLVDPQ